MICEPMRRFEVDIEDNDVMTLMGTVVERGGEIRRELWAA
jgi:hypothetical protein